MADEAEAAGILVLACKRLKLENLLGDDVSSCTVKYTRVRRKKGRACSWNARDSVLSVEIRDKSMDAGLLRAISSFSRASTGRNSRLFMRFSFIPYLLFISRGVSTPSAFTSAHLMGYGPVVTLAIGYSGLVATVTSMFWAIRVDQKEEKVFAERLIRITSLDETRVHDLLSDFIGETKRTKLLIMSLGAALIFLLCILLVWTYF